MKLFAQRKCGAGTLVVALVVCLLAEARLGLAADDKVTLFRNGEVVSGRIKKEDMESVEMEIRDPRGPGAVMRKFTPGEVAEMEWEITDPACAADWREGVNAYKKGSYSKAAGSFGTIIADKEVEKAFRPEAKPCLYYLYAESLYRAEKTSEATPAFEAFMKDYQNSSYMPLAVGSMVDSAITEGKYEKVPKMLADLRRLGAEQKAFADYYEGKLLRAKKDPAGADKKFADAAAGSSVPATKGMALMGQASCAVDQNNPAKARELAQKALASNPPTSVAGAAHLVIGDAILAEIDAKKPGGDALQNMLLDAVLEYLRVHLQYGGDRNTEPKALFKAGECLQILAKKFPQRGIDRQRAITMFSKLKEDPKYRATDWAKQADEALKKLNR